MSWDEVLGAALLWLCKAAFQTFAFIIFVGALWVLPAIVFPNGTGWHDLSNMEILFLTGLVVLNARYVAKVRKHSASVRRAVYRYLLGFGLHTLLFLSAITILNGSVAPDSDFSMYNTREYWITAYEISLLIMLFAIVPKGQFVKTQSSPENTPPESSTTMEGSTDNV